MKHIKKIAVILLAVLSVAFASFAISCGKNVDITFETGGVVAVEKMNVEKSKETDLPVPEKEGYEFIGWYDNAEYSGSSISKLTPEKNTVLYAKWEKLAVITLDLNGGSVSGGNTRYVKVNSAVLDAVKNVVPTKTGFQFGKWTCNDRDLTNSVKASEQGVTVKAEYKVSYQVEIYLEKLDGKGYEKREENVTGYDYEQKNYTPDCTVTGFEYVANAGEVTIKDLTSDYASNVYKMYFDRKITEVTYRPEYPDGTEADDVVDTMKYGSGKTVKNDLTCAGYVLMGWATEKGGEIVYATNFFNLKEKVYGIDENEVMTSDVLTLEEDTILYGVWKKGLSNMLGGTNYVYLLSDDANVVYLCRGGVYFRGVYVPSSKLFTFYGYDDEGFEGDVVAEGKIVDSENYIYNNTSRDNLELKLFDRQKKTLSDDVSLIFDGYNGVIYYDKKNITQSKGTYVIENGQYVATFTDGPLAEELEGKKYIFLVQTVQDTDGNVFYAFTPRNEEEVAYGEIPLIVLDSSTHIPFAVTGFTDGRYKIKLNGFGVAEFGSYVSSTASVQKVNYNYTIVGDLIKLTTTTNGSSAGVLKLTNITVDGKSIFGYAFYTQEEERVYKNGNATLTMDGTFNAVYFDGANTVNGYYVTSELYTGNKVDFYAASGDQSYVFLTKETASVTDGAIVTEYTFDKKIEGYAEYRYSDEVGKYYSPFLVVNDGAKGNAVLYARSKQGTYVKVSSGTYAASSTLANSYVYVADEYYSFTEEIFDEPMRVDNIERFVYTVESTYIYFHSYTLKGETATDLTNTKKIYTADGTNDKLELFGGFAFFTSAQETVVGSYTTKDGLTTVKTSSATYYFELDDATSKFVQLEHTPYKAYAYSQAGTSDTSVYFYFDGKGGAVYTKESGKDTEGIVTYDFRISGKVKDTGRKSAVSNANVYVFTSDDNSTTVQYILLSASNRAYFSEYTGAANGVNMYTSVSDGVLELDGYSYLARYTNTNGEKKEYNYVISSENVARVIINGSYRYFDLNNNGNNKTFTLRGIEYGVRVYIDNQQPVGYYFEFDGYTKLKVFNYKTETVGDKTNTERDYIDENGSYTRLEDGSYKLTYKPSATSDAIQVVGKIGYYIYGNSALATFIKVYEVSLANTYVNPVDLTVITFDNAGTAVKYTQGGGSQSGQYVIVTDDLLFYLANDYTDACLYKYDAENKTVEEIRYDRKMAFYTRELNSIKFSEYGFAVFTGEDVSSSRYYYLIEDGNYVIYRPAKEGETANAFGFVRETFCTEQELVAFQTGISKIYEGNEYFYANGWDIEFNRVEATKDEYPVLVAQDTKKPFEKLQFSPDGEEFSVNGTVVIDGENYNCVVTRAAIKDKDGNATGKYETYFTIGYYRVDVDLTYLGVDGEGKSRSSYSVNAMSFSRLYYAYGYYTVYSYIAAMLGPTYANNLSNDFGTIVYEQTFDATGEAINPKFTGKFGSSSGFVDLTGKNIEAIEATEKTDNKGYYLMEVVGADGYTYRLHFTVQSNLYYVISFTRVQNFNVTTSVDGVDKTFSVEIEKTIFSDLSSSGINYKTGQVYDIKVTDGENTVKFSEMGTIGGGWCAIYREKTEKGNITKTVYYRFGLVDNDDEVKSDYYGQSYVVSPASYKSLDMTITNMTTVYWESGENMYVDIDEKTHTIVLMYRKATDGEGFYETTECTYDETTKTYSITLNTGKKYTVKIKDDGTAEIKSVETEQN